MADCSTLKLIMEKGPREGETLEYTSRCVVKIGRVARGNTIAVKDAGISSKHICIKFDNESGKWILSDLDSSNGTILNGQNLKPNAPSGLKDGDCIKIGEITSIVVKIGVGSTTLSEKKPRRQGKSEAGADVAVEKGPVGSGFDGDLGKVAVEGPVEKRNLRSRSKKAMDPKNEMESLSSKRTLRSSTKEKNVTSIPTLKQIPENMNVDLGDSIDHFVPMEPKRRGRKRNMAVQPPEDPDLDERKPADAGKNTRRGRKGLAMDQPEIVQSSGVEENLNNNNKSVVVDVAEEVAFDKCPVNYLEENLDTNNESAQEHVAAKLVSTQEGCEVKEALVDQSLVSEPVLEVHMDQGKKRQDGCATLAKDTGLDDSQWLDLEKMTLGDFFDYLEVQLPKDIHEKSEKIISHMAEKARKCHEFRLQRNENGDGKVNMN